MSRSNFAAYLDDLDNGTETVTGETKAVEAATRKFYSRHRKAVIFAGVGDGVADDSAAWNAFVAECMSRGRPGIIPPGTYRVPGATAISVTAKLRLVGNSDDPPILDGEKAASNYLIRLVNKSLVLRNMIFKNFTDVVSAGDGTGGSLPATLTGDIAQVSVRKVQFFNCRRPMFSYVSSTGPTLDKFEVIDCYVDGETTGWAGFFWAWTKMGKARANKNHVINIDATAAGYGSGGTGAPANVGNGRAILMGGNNPGAVYGTFGWEANDNTVENVTDSRNKQASTNPEVGAVRVTGADYSSMCGNKIRNVKSTGIGVDDDCEPIYPKNRWSLIKGNIILDGGINGTALIIKGFNRVKNGDTGDGAASGYGGVCCDNIIVNTTGLRASGIAVFTSDWIVKDNYIEGCGGDTNRYAPLWANAGQNDNIAFVGNTIKNAIGAFGIFDAGYGINHRIEGNTIDGILASIAGLTAQTVVGINLFNVDANGFNTGALPLVDCTVAGNKVGGLVAMSGQQARLLQVSGTGSPVTRLRVDKNIATTAMDVAVALVGGTIAGITISGNDWSNVSDDYLTTGSPTVTDLVANNNSGWLYSELSVNVASIPPGIKSAVVSISIAASGVVTWDAHGFGVGTVVKFETTGALPTGISAGTPYFVSSVVDANSFTLSASPNGANITTTGSQSGVHTGSAQAIAVGSVSVTDAATRDRVIVTSSSNTVGGFLWGVVNAAGIVTVYLFNPTAVAIDPINSTYRIKVEKFAA